jgi:hypothetical protein
VALISPEENRRKRGLDPGEGECLSASLRFRNFRTVSDQSWIRRLGLPEKPISSFHRPQGKMYSISKFAFDAKNPG